MIFIPNFIFMNSIRKIIPLVLLSLALTSCTGPDVQLGEFTFNLPSSWTLESQSGDTLYVSYAQDGEVFPLAVEYKESSVDAVQEGIPRKTREDVILYEDEGVEGCDGFFCYGILRLDDYSAFLIQFTDNGNTSSLTRYSLAESMRDFIDSVR